MKEPLIFDTSVWIDFFNDKNTDKVELLASYIENNDRLLLTPTIVQEILQGIRNDKQYRRIKNILS